jgi:hypothetical protein
MPVSGMAPGGLCVRAFGPALHGLGSDDEDDFFSASATRRSELVKHVICASRYWLVVPSSVL